MSLRAVGRRFSAVLGSGLALGSVFSGSLFACGLFACGLFACGLFACGLDDPASNGVSSGAESPQPERVVQRIEPARATLTGNTAPGSNGSAGNDSASNDSRASIAVQPSSNASSGASPAGRSALTAANTPRQVETISPKHLEAELNRLEAEIGN